MCAFWLSWLVCSLSPWYRYVITCCVNRTFLNNQVPKIYLPFDEATSISDLGRACYRLSRDTLQDLYDPPADILVTIRYFDAVFNFMTGKRAVWGE